MGFRVSGLGHHPTVEGVGVGQRCLACDVSPSVSVEPVASHICV